MCLTPEWFEESPRRIAKWDKDGVTTEEAKEALNKIGSTVYPIASEMASWLYRHWTLEQIDALGTGFRAAFLRAIGDPDVMHEMVFDLGQRFTRTRRVVALDNLPSPALIRHRWKTPDIDQGEFLGIFRGNARKHVVLYGDKHFDYVGDWLKAVRSHSWNWGKPSTHHIEGTFSGAWWENVAVMKEGQWVAIVKSLPGLAVNFD